MSSGERTEEATPKRREDARKKGQVLRSTEATTAVMLLASAWLLQRMLPEATQTLMELTQHTFETAAEATFTPAGVQQQGLALLLIFARLVAPVLLGLCVAAVISSLGQVGFLLSGEALKPQFSRLSPMQGAKRLFSTRALAETVKTVVKLLVIGYAAWGAVQDNSDRLAMLTLTHPGAAGGILASMVMNVVWKTIGVFIIIAAADYAYQRWSYRKGLRMSREEIKQEYKSSEGNPEIKSRLRQRARALAQGRMMQDVPKADVVLANPTHFAVALKYEPGMASPKVLARGADFIAQQIKKVAREHGVPVVENKPLAQALYSACEIGQSVPPELFKAVAEVLAFVYRLRHGPAPRRPLSPPALSPRL